MRLEIPSVDKTQTRIYQDSIRHFNRVLANLSYAEQNLLHLSCYQELPVKEIADRYGMTSRAINRRLQRIDRKLEQAFRLQIPA